MNLNDFSTQWIALHEQLGIGFPIKTKSHYERLLGVADELMITVEREPKHVLGGLLELVTERIQDYERRHDAWPNTSTPSTRLQFLMDQHGLKQSDLPEIGAQSVVSAILSGKRQMNLRQVTAVAKRFALPVDALI